MSDIPAARSDNPDDANAKIQALNKALGLLDQVVEILDGESQLLAAAQIAVARETIRKALHSL